MECGGAEGARTPDLDTASVALSQLSYGPTSNGALHANKRSAGTATRPAAGLGMGAANATRGDERDEARRVAQLELGGDGRS